MQQKNEKKHIKSKPQGDMVFALDIGTRTVVGIIGESRDEEFVMTDYTVEPHTKRAMSDGQIEDVRQVAKVVAKVKNSLEEKNGVILSSVSIAAAGRALRTSLVKMEFDISQREMITADMIKSMEIETIQKAQNELNENNAASGDGLKNSTFYCVGYSVINYALDDYKMLNLETHKGQKASVELIATFLPSVVVDGLYSVMSLCGLEVASMTLEPIAAMNVVVPPEIRAINIALVDIGAGTSDIAISREGSVVAYSMATTAGDEITEEIIKAYFVDFNTAEQMKQNSTSGLKEFEYRDIFGIVQKITTSEFNKKIDHAVENLASAVCEHIQSANKTSPAAAFLVGGGSLIGGLSQKVAKKLGLEENRVAIGNHRNLRGVDTGGRELGAEFVTPVGIALTSILNKGYDFSVIILNGEKIRVFDTKKLSVFELLTMAGYKTTDIMGRSGRSLNFTVNGKRKIVKGGHFAPAVITVNNKPASVNTLTAQGDAVTFEAATCGENAKMTLSQLIDEYGGLDKIGDVELLVNGKVEKLSYEISPFDRIEMTAYDEEEGGDYNNSDNSDKFSELYGYNHDVPPGDVYTDTKPEEYGEITLSLNGAELTLEPTPDRSPHKFLELLNHTKIDLTNPVASYKLLLNDREASFNDPIKAGDRAIIEITEKETAKETTEKEVITETTEEEAIIETEEEEVTETTEEEAIIETEKEVIPEITQKEAG